MKTTILRTIVEKLGDRPLSWEAVEQALERPWSISPP